MPMQEGWSMQQQPPAYGQPIAQQPVKPMQPMQVVTATGPKQVTLFDWWEPQYIQSCCYAAFCTGPAGNELSKRKTVIKYNI